jgi:hypothetical protein
MLTLPVFAYIFIIPSIQLHLKSFYHTIESTHIIMLKIQLVSDELVELGLPIPVLCTHQIMGLMIMMLIRVEWDERIVSFGELVSTSGEAVMAYFKTLPSIQSGKIHENQKNILHDS